MTRKRKIGKFNFIYCAAILIFLLIFLFAIYQQAAEYFELKQQLKQVQKEQTEIVNKNIDLINEIAYQDTDAYAEKIARERLGLVKPNEIVFIDENK